MQTWFVVSNEVGTILAVYGAALEREARAKGKTIREATSCGVALHSVKGPRPSVYGSISMRGALEWL